MKQPRLIDFNYGKNVYERGKFEENYFNYYEAFALCQFYIWHLNYGFQKCKNKLEEFIKNSDPNFNKVTSFMQIKKIVRKAMKKEPDFFPVITITSSEIEKIQTIKNFNYQKFLFSILCYAKREKFDTTRKDKKSDFLGYHIYFKTVHKICLDMNMRISEKKLENWLSIFYDLKLIEGTASGTRDTRFVSIFYSDDNSKPILQIESLDIPFEKYIEFCGGEKIYCKNCENCVDKEYKNQKYCNKCKIEKRREFTRNRVRNFRKNNKSIM